MSALPTFAALEDLADYLDRKAGRADATALTLDEIDHGCGDELRQYAKRLREAAKQISWMAGRADRLREIDGPVRRPNSYGRTP